MKLSTFQQFWDFRNWLEAIGTSPLTLLLLEQAYDHGAEIVCSIESESEGRAIG